MPDKSKNLIQAKNILEGISQEIYLFVQIILSCVNSDE